MTRGDGPPSGEAEAVPDARLSGNAPSARTSQKAPPARSPREALERLMEGNRRFSRGEAIRPEKSAHERREQILAQAPYAAILGCSDSRVPIEIVFDQGLGDLFIVRVAGNVASSGVLASLEFAVEALPCRLIMVLGHRGCGAVDAAVRGSAAAPGPTGGAGAVPPPVGGGSAPGPRDMAGGTPTDGLHLPALLEGMRSGLERLPSALAGEDEEGGRSVMDRAVIGNVIVQVAALRANPVVAAALAEGRIKVVGAWYDLESSRVELVESTLPPA